MARRMGYVMELDRRGPPQAGSEVQQQAVRDMFDKYVFWQSRLDRVLYNLARHVKVKHRNYVSITFDELPNPAWLGWAAANTIILADKMTDPGLIERYLLHEMGHVLDQQVLSWTDRLAFLDSREIGYWQDGYPHNGAERFAWDFQAWIAHDSYDPLLEVALLEADDE